MYIIDPDADDRALLQLLLRKAGVAHELTTHATAEDFVAAVSSAVAPPVTALIPTLCFIDDSLPGMGTEQLVRWIRAQRALDRMSLILLSRTDVCAALPKVAAAGAQCHLAKYPQPSVLRQVLNEAQRLAQSSAADEWFGLSANLLLRWFSPARRRPA